MLDALDARDAEIATLRERLRVVEGERDQANAEIGRCHGLALVHTGSASVEPLDVWLERILLVWKELGAHHEEHHVRDETLRAQRDRATVLVEAMEGALRPLVDLLDAPKPPSTAYIVGQLEARLPQLREVLSSPDTTAFLAERDAERRVVEAAVEINDGDWIVEHRGVERPTVYALIPTELLEELARRCAWLRSTAESATITA